MVESKRGSTSYCKIMMTEIEEKALAEAIRQARGIQEFLWGRMNEAFGLEEWRRMFRKRVMKIDEIDTNNPYAYVELKKRILQQAALSIAALAHIEKHGLLPEHLPDEPVSNLSQYSKPP